MLQCTDARCIHLERCLDAILLNRKKYRPISIDTATVDIEYIVLPYYSGKTFLCGYFSIAFANDRNHTCYYSLEAMHLDVLFHIPLIFLFPFRAG